MLIIFILCMQHHLVENFNLKINEFNTYESYIYLYTELNTTEFWKGEKYMFMWLAAMEILLLLYKDFLKGDSVVCCMWYDIWFSWN